MADNDPTPHTADYDRLVGTAHMGADHARTTSLWVEHFMKVTDDELVAPSQLRSVARIEVTQEAICCRDRPSHHRRTVRFQERCDDGLQPPGNADKVADGSGMRSRWLITVRSGAKASGSRPAPLTSYLDARGPF